MQILLETTLRTMTTLVTMMKQPGQYVFTLDFRLLGATKGTTLENRSLLVNLGEPSNQIFGNTWDFVPTRGAGV